jgi:hypothetical protein
MYVLRIEGNLGTEDPKFGRRKKEARELGSQQRSNSSRGFY